MDNLVGFFDSTEKKITAFLSLLVTLATTLGVLGKRYSDWKKTRLDHYRIEIEIERARMELDQVRAERKSANAKRENARNDPSKTRPPTCRTEEEITAAE